MKKKRKKQDGVGSGLYRLYLLFLLLSIGLVIKLISIQTGFTPDPEIERALTPASYREIIEPARGSILAKDGRLLAMSIPIYDIYMDCTVKRAAFAADKVNGEALEQEWRQKAKGLAEGLSAILGDKSADMYYKMIIRGRTTGKKYQPIARKIERKVYNQLVELPLFNEGRYSGGIIAEKTNVRMYPYGSLARRTIGFVRDNKSSVGNTHVGLEGRFDHVLHGKEGYFWTKKVDANHKVQNSDSLYVKAEDGLDVRSTIDIDLQDILDKAVKEQIEDDEDIEGGCAIIMDVRTGAIRAMVNLLRDTLTNRLTETQNLAIGRLGEPGSVFKTSTLMTLLEDGKIKSLDDRIPTNGGAIHGFNRDDHIVDYERKNKTKEIPIIDGFEMSSNYMFRYLAMHNYVGREQERNFIEKLYMYKLGEAFDFDLEGLAAPAVPSPDSKTWSKTDLGSVAIGYSVSETPLHIITFYNGIANKGKLMRPYLVESIEENGTVKEKYGPSVLNASICSRATADTLTRALKAVTKEGTAQRLKDARCDVAGKTGTSRIVLPTGGYEDPSGRKKNQGTFVGFFPADDPKYSIIVVVYSKLSYKNFYGGTKPAAAVRTVVDKIYAIDPTWGDRLCRRGALPVFGDSVAVAGKVEAGKMPDLKGLGLRDAMYIIENSDCRCSYSGVGHVVSQTPEAGGPLKAGSTVKIVLK